MQDDILEKFVKERRQLNSAVLCCAIIASATILFAHVMFFRADERLAAVESTTLENDAKVRNLKEIANNIETNINSIKEEINNNKENVAYVYTKIAAIQKDIAIIKDKLHIENAQANTDVKKMRADDVNFIDALESLVMEGAPFADFIKQQKKRNILAKYASWKALNRFANDKIDSLQELQKDFVNIAQSEFGITINESFWEKQKRVIKEKIMNVMRIKKGNPDDDKPDLDDHSLLLNAASCINDGNIKESMEFLKNLKKRSDVMEKFIKKAEKRIQLNDAFYEFKTEFVANSQSK